jgi:hypothetical protein
MRRAAPLALLVLPWPVACGDATEPVSEELTEPGPRSAAGDRALSFDGLDDYASAGTARMPQIERPQTLMLWVRAEGALGDPAHVEVLLTLRRSDWRQAASSLSTARWTGEKAPRPRPLTRAPWSSGSFSVYRSASS